MIFFPSYAAHARFWNFCLIAHFEKFSVDYAMLFGTATENIRFLDTSYREMREKLLHTCFPESEEKKFDDAAS
jgi:hypothetical protein